jgi:ABC-type oligopeptide transport system ATPase subunit
MDPLVDVRALSKSFRRQRVSFRKSPALEAVKEVSFEIPRGSFFGLVGESGCGKTTLARSMIYLDPPDRGEVAFDGVVLGELSRKQMRRMRRRMQIVFQNPQSVLDPRMKVKALLFEPLRNRGVPKPEREQRTLGILNSVGLESSALSRFPHEFSGGQRQRITLARALAMEPDFLILDEPVSSLDVSVQAQIMNLLKDLKESFSLTYLFISHDLNLVSYSSDIIAVMKRGEIVEIAPTGELLSDPLHPYTRKLLYSIPGKPREMPDRGPGMKLPDALGRRSDSPASNGCGEGRPSLVEVKTGHYVAYPWDREGQ